MYNGEPPLREVCGGDFVVVNLELHDMFDDFKRSQSSYLNCSSLISCNALIDVYRTTRLLSASHSKLIKINGKTYNIIWMDHFEIDTLCEWILNKRDEVKEKGRSNILSVLSENKVNVSIILCLRL